MEGSTCPAHVRINEGGSRWKVHRAQFPLELKKAVTQEASSCPAHVRIKEDGHDGRFNVPSSR